MPDREKVISTLEDIKTQTAEIGLDSAVIAHKFIDKILALLKEQEAVKPYQHDAVWLCGNCEKEVVGWDDDFDGKEYRYPFCRQCGKAVKWNDS